MHTPVSIDGFTRRICGETEVQWGGKKKIRSYRKIFALLVLVGATASTPFFLEQEVSDLNLPLYPLLSDEDNEYKEDEPICSFDYFEDLNWSPIQIRTFQEYQWKMLAPFFAKGKHGDVIHYHLKEHHILPFLPVGDAGETTEKSGGYARVVMVRIHDAHHGFHGPRRGNICFAVKQQRDTRDRDSFRNEIAVLKKFSGDGRGHKHIISLLATFEQFDKLNLLLYRADGDLFAYWNQFEDPPNFTHDNVNWLAEQCEGLVEALLRVHKHLTFTNKFEESIDASSSGLFAMKDVTNLQRSNTAPYKKVKFTTGSHGRQDDTISQSQSAATSGLISAAENVHELHDKQYGRHGDIHPGNILWFNDSESRENALSGTLKIADFGQAEFNSLKSKTAPRDVANALTYRPPECDRLVRNEKPLIRQRYDIWCLGCVFFEFLTWMLGGKQLQHDFSKARMTPDFFENHSLTDTFFQVRRKLESNGHEVIIKPEVTEAIDYLHQHANCSDFLHEFLDLIRHDMLVVDSSERSECHMVWQRLHRMLKQCRIHKTYAADGRPWHTTLKPMSRPMTVNIKEINTGLDAVDTDSGVTSTVTQASRLRKKRAKRNEWSHRNRRGNFKPDFIRR